MKNLVLLLLFYTISFSQTKSQICDSKMTDKINPLVKALKLGFEDTQNDVDYSKSRCGLHFHVVTFSSFEDMKASMENEFESSRTLTLEEAVILWYQNRDICKSAVFFPYLGKSLFGCLTRPKDKTPIFFSAVTKSVKTENQTFRLVVLKQ